MLAKQALHLPRGTSHPEVKGLCWALESVTCDLGD